MTPAINPMIADPTTALPLASPFVFSLIFKRFLTQKVALTPMIATKITAKIVLISNDEIL